MSKESLREKVKEHLEFLGYEISADKDDGPFLASSESRSNLVVVIASRMILLNSRWTGLQIKALKSRDFFTELNEANKGSSSTWTYIEEDDGTLTLSISSTTFGYEKAAFGELVENYEFGVKDFLPTFAKYVED